ncbi:MAG: TPM domain-containing protein [Chitinophagales bacterium]|nr:TPM domain-containing protein [Chitinophagales bacterium]MDW8393096.1 TPM domain-containing protein [Chitinophagales bacterium]
MTDRPLLTAQEQQFLAQAIADVEKQTTGEIKIFLEPECPTDPYVQAQKKFFELNLHQTRQRTGVLIYVAYQSHHFAVLADTGLHHQLPDGFWNNLRDELTEQFRNKPLAEALHHAVTRCGAALMRYAPAAPSNPDELSNRVEIV